MILDIHSDRTLKFIGRIDVDEDTGACRFVNGDDSLRIHIERTLTQGPRIELNKISPSDPQRFKLALDTVLSLGGFCTAATAEWYSTTSHVEP